MNYGFWSILPPLLAITLALITKNVFIALFFGCLLSYIVIADGHFFAGLDETLMSFVKVFQDTDNTIVILVVILLGGLTYLIEHSGAEYAAHRGYHPSAE